MTLRWRRSSYSGGANDELCVEVAHAPIGVAVRDSKDPEHGHLILSTEAFGARLAYVKEQ